MAMAIITPNIRIMILTSILYLAATKLLVVNAFSSFTHFNSRALLYINPHKLVSSSSTTSLQMAGFGGISSSATKTRKKKNKKSSKMNNNSETAFDVSAALIRSEKLYDEIMYEDVKALFRNEEEEEEWGSEFITTTTEKNNKIISEYMITARYHNPTGGKPLPGSASLSDWIPVAQLCLSRNQSNNDNDDDNDGKHHLPAAISSIRREIHHAATIAAPVFSSLPRNAIQYGAEPIDSFHKFVYEDVVEGKQQKSEDGVTMTKVRAREILGLDDDSSDGGAIKSAYRSKTFQYHPDRFVGLERSEEERNDTNQKLALVKLAYETLSSGVRTQKQKNGESHVNGVGIQQRQSWYESLGGRARTDFMGPIDMLPLEQAKMMMEDKMAKCAVVGLEADLVMTFVSRNQAALSS